MSLDGLRAVLDRLDEASCCSGTYKPDERVAIALPDGDVGAVSDAQFCQRLHAALNTCSDRTRAIDGRLSRERSNRHTTSVLVPGATLTTSDATFASTR